MSKPSFPIYNNNINLHAVFGNMYRDKHVLIVLRDELGNFLLGAKPDFYPEGIFRFVGGGIDEGETPEEAGVREIKEELQIDINKDELKPLAEVITSGDFNNETIKNSTYMFEFLITDLKKIIPSDDIAYLETMSSDELSKLINRYKELSVNDWFEAPDGYRHCWSDYGEMYAFIHQLALDLGDER